MEGLEDNGHRELARVLRKWAASHAPDWTDENDADPGITVLALFAFLTERLDALGQPIPERARRSAARLARAALALAGAKEPGQDCGLARNRYFAGRLLGAQDFQLEQDYFRERLRRHNRALHGAGIVDGLQVSVGPESGGGEQVVVQPGFALDPYGEEIAVRCEVSISLPGTGHQLFVMLSYAERLTQPMPASDDEPVQFTRVEETFALHVEETSKPSGIALARLIRTSAGWTIDEAFLLPRIRAHHE